MKMFTHILGLQTNKQTPKEAISRNSLSQWQSALKWDLGGVQPGSTPSSHSGEIAFTCAPAADSTLTSGGQSEVQAMIQQFPYTPPLHSMNQ